MFSLRIQSIRDVWGFFVCDIIELDFITKIDKEMANNSYDGEIMRKSMNIYLTSYGVDTRYDNYMNSYDDIVDVLKGKKVAVIPNAHLLSEDRTNSVVAKEELVKNGIEADIIDLDYDDFNISRYSALYLSGGEPRNLMNSINNAGLFEDIKNFIDNGGTVIGQSAGAMIFCKKYLDTTTGKLLSMNNGFDYTNKMIVPHFENLPNDILKQLPDDVIKIYDSGRLFKLELGDL